MNLKIYTGLCPSMSRYSLERNENFIHDLFPNLETDLSRMDKQTETISTHRKTATKRTGHTNMGSMQLIRMVT